jgi:hypothetical protein
VLLLLGALAGFVLGLKVGMTLGHRAERRELLRLKGDGSAGAG